MQAPIPATAHAVRLALCGAVALSMLCAAPATSAGSYEARLTVSATVPKRASVDILRQPNSVIVTAADITRGFVDAPGTAQVAIRCNSPAGYLLEFAIQGDFLRQVIASSGANELEVGRAGATSLRPCKGMGVAKTIVNLNFRFMLAERAKAGTYLWPIRLSVYPF